MPECCGIAANSKLLWPQGDRGTTASHAVCFRDPWIHHHPPSPVFDGSITSPYCSCSRANSKTNGVSLRQSTRKSTGARTCRNEPSQHSRAAVARKNQKPFLHVGNGARLESRPHHLAKSLCNNGMVNMGCRGLEWQTWAKYFIKETSVVYSMRVFATVCLSSGAVLPLYTPSSQSCLRCLHPNTTETPSLHTLQQPSFSKKEQNKEILLTYEKPSHFVTWMKITVSFRECRSKPVMKEVFIEERAIAEGIPQEGIEIPPARQNSGRSAGILYLGLHFLTP